MFLSIFKVVSKVCGLRFYDLVRVININTKIVLYLTQLSTCLLNAKHYFMWFNPSPVCIGAKMSAIFLCNSFAC